MNKMKRTRVEQMTLKRKSVDRLSGIGLEAGFWRSGGFSGWLDKVVRKTGEMVLGRSSGRS